MKKLKVTAQPKQTPKKKSAVRQVATQQKISAQDALNQGTLISFLGLDRYTPKKNEAYMSSKQLKYFQAILAGWQDKLLEQSESTLNSLKKDNEMVADVLDQAAQDESMQMMLKTRERDLALMSKIEKALKKIEDGSYGYCEKTDEPIGFQRLEARPIADLCIEAQERHERMQELYKGEES
jgi:DnaK suppressor protein